MQYRPGGFMNLKYPLWQEPLAAAILEFSPQQLPEKLQRAEEAIANRIHELTAEKNNEDELRALSDGLSIIRGVKQDRVALPDQKSRRRSTGSDDVREN